VKTLRVPAALVVVVIGGAGGAGCGDDSRAKRDAATSVCQVICYPDGSDAGVCPETLTCVSETLPHSCPSGCTCSAYCFPRTAEGELNCPTADGLDCAAPDRTCPAGCDPVG
jgi:hypothetical protein